MSVVFATPLLAADLPTLQSHIMKGDYAAALLAAENLETADAKALAAESLLSEIMLGQAEKNKKQAKRARKLAEAALDIDPAHQNGRLQYAIADGFVTRETGDVSAWMKKLPQKTHAIVEAYRADFPNDPRGDALLGAWHLAIARKAGNKNAQKWFDASISQGRELFLAAREKEPEDIVIGVNYAFSLLALDAEDFPDTQEAQGLLSNMLEVEPRDHLESVLKSYAEGALSLIEDRDQVAEFTGQFLDGKKPE